METEYMEEDDTEGDADVDHIHDDTNTMEDNGDGNEGGVMDNLELDAMGTPVPCPPPLQLHLRSRLC